MSELNTRKDLLQRIMDFANEHPRIYAVYKRVEPEEGITVYRFLSNNPKFDYDLETELSSIDLRFAAEEKSMLILWHANPKDAKIYEFLHKCVWRK